MTYASKAVQIAAMSAADALTAIVVKGGVSKAMPYWRIEVVDEDESGKNKDGEATAVRVFASLITRDIEEVYSEMVTMGNSLPTAISPAGFRVLGVQSRTRQIGGSDEPDNVIYGRQLEIELIVEPTA